MAKLLVEFFADLVGSPPSKTPTLVTDLQNPAKDVATVLGTPGGYGLSKGQISVLMTQDRTLIANRIIEELEAKCAGIVLANPDV